MPDIFKLASFDFTGKHGQTRMFAFQGLYSGHFIRAQYRLALLGQFGCFLIDRVDLLDFLVKAFIGFRGQPVADQVRLEAPFLSNRAAWRAEMRSRIPRLTISSAISRLVHWLIGRPAFSGFSQASCSIWQIWSAVIRAGAPGLGRSSNRSSRLKSSIEMGCKSNQRCRHNRAVSNGHLQFLANFFMVLTRRCQQHHSSTQRLLLTGLVAMDQFFQSLALDIAQFDLRRFWPWHFFSLPIKIEPILSYFLAYFSPRVLVVKTVFDPKSFLKLKSLCHH